VCELAAELRQQGKSLLDRLDELFEEHGYFLESQRSETCKGPKGRAMIVKLMQEFAEHPPKELGGLQLSKVRDYVRHEVRSLPDNKRSGDLPEPQGDMLIFETRSPNCAVTLAARPSGTEPKIKFYFFARAERSPGDTLAVVKERTAKTLRDFENALSAWAQGVFASE
jgi:phosphoglucomutase/phosphomannomutase